MQLLVSFIRSKKRYNCMSEEKSVFELGDQDYGSAIGWEPKGMKNGSFSRKLIEDDKKRNPRDYAKTPDMLWAMPMSWWVGVGVSYPPMEQLFGPFWTHGELAVLFARAGVGKSALATQIGENLARGLRMAPFDEDGAVTEPQNVLYLDFELSTAQLAARYSVLDAETGSYTNGYEFSERFKRSTLNWNGRLIEGYDDFSDMFFTALSEAVEVTGTTVLIIDNITFLDESSTSNVDTALSIMRSLNALKQKRGLSILVLAHSRRRGRSNRLSSDDMQGSVNVANFADSVFAMETSRKAADLRYLKQLKMRTGMLEHGHSRVPVFSLAKFDSAAKYLAQNPARTPIPNFLGMSFRGFDTEDAHVELPQSFAFKQDRQKGPSKSFIKKAVKELSAGGKSLRDIAAELGLSQTTVMRYKNGVASI